jgi:hypothetical protein
MASCLVALIVVSACSENPVDSEGGDGTACGGRDYRLHNGDADWFWQKTECSELLRAVAGENGSYVIGGDNMLKTSETGLNWETRLWGGNSEFHDIVATSNKFIAVGTRPSAMIVSFTEYYPTFYSYPTGQEKTLNAIGSSSKAILAVGDEGESVISSNGTEWTRLTPVTESSLRDVIDYGMWLVVAGDSGSVMSTTEGVYFVDWESGLDYNFYGLAANGRSFVFVSDDGVIVTADPDHDNWKVHEIAPGHRLNAVAWTGELFIVVGERGLIATSSDAQCWSVFNSGLSADLLNVTSSEEIVAVGTESTVLISRDGYEWEARPSGPPMVLHDVVWTGLLFVVVGRDGTVLTSNNGKEWTRVEISGIDWIPIRAITVGSSGIWAVGAESVVLRSTTGQQWERTDPEISQDFYSVHCSDSQVLVGGVDGMIFTTEDGTSWRADTLSGGPAIFSIAESPTVTVAATTRGLYYSNDGEWHEPPFILSRTHCVCWSGTEFIAGNHGNVYTSTDGVYWNIESLTSEAGFLDAASNGTRSIVVGSSGVIYARVGDDGEWMKEETRMPNEGTFWLSGATWSDYGFVVVGDRGTILTDF